MFGIYDSKGCANSTMCIAEGDSVDATKTAVCSYVEGCMDFYVLVYFWQYILRFYDLVHVSHFMATNGIFEIMNEIPFVVDVEKDFHNASRVDISPKNCSSYINN